MLRFDGFLKNPTPEVFNPRVTPDPSESERLEAKLHDAMQRMRNSLGKNYGRNILGSQRQGTG